MNVSEAYNAWSETYDDVVNPTRDLEARAIRAMVAPSAPCAILELACGTGKNTSHLKTLASNLVAVDFSDEMLAKARLKHPDTDFRRLDLRDRWPFDDATFEFVTCSLALEHIDDLVHVFGEAARVLKPGGRFYFGELHPFKQYQGSKARFERGDGETFVVECFVHHVGEYFDAATRAGFVFEDLREWFDDGVDTPRLLAAVCVSGAGNS